MQSIAGFLANAVVSAAVFAQAGRGHKGVHLSLPSGRLLVPIVIAIIVIGGIAATTAPGRRYLKTKVWPFLRSAGMTVKAVASDPVKLGMGMIAALMLPTVQIISLALCVRAFGGGVPISSLAATYMAVRVIAGAAPTPGGLGAVEAGLIAGLTALGMPAGPATGAVLTYRLLSYWLNIPVGAAFLAVVQRRGFV
jgi:uncharacterized protein (TIRG00374 family)